MIPVRGDIPALSLGLSDFHQLVLHDHPDSVAGIGNDRFRPGECAKRRQEPVLKTEMETGHDDRLPTFAPESITGMNMAGKVIHSIRNLLEMIVCQHETTYWQLVIHDLNTKLVIMCLVQDIVVSFYQEKLHLPMPGDLHAKGVPFPIVLAVEQIAEKEDLFGLTIQDQLVEPSQIGFGQLTGNGNTRFSEMSGFANMQVGNEQCLSGRKPDGALRKQVDRFAGQVDLGHLDKFAGSRSIRHHLRKYVSSTSMGKPTSRSYPPHWSAP